MNLTNPFANYSELTWVCSMALAPIGLHITNVEENKESKEYGALYFQIKDRHVHFRVAKITPKKRHNL